MVVFPAAREGSTAILSMWVGVTLSLRWEDHGGEDEGRSCGAAERHESCNGGGDAGAATAGNVDGNTKTAATEGDTRWIDENATGLSQQEQFCISSRWKSDGDLGGTDGSAGWSGANGEGV